MKHIRSILFAAVAALLAAGGLVYAQTSPCSGTVNCQVGNRWIIGETRSVTGTLEILGGGQVKWGATIFKPVRGETALDGSNPTPISTGLASIDACSVSIKTTVAPGVGTSVVTYSTSTATLNLYGWKPTSSSDTTLVASTATETVGWLCWGK